MSARVKSRFNNILLFQLYRLLNDQVNNDKLKPAQLLNVFLFLFFATKKDVNTSPQINVRTLKSFFFYFSTKTYVVGTQKNRLNETVLLIAQNICLDYWVRK